MKVAVIGSRGLNACDLERYPPKDVTPFIVCAQPSPPSFYTHNMLAAP